MTSSFEKKNILCSNYFPLLALCCEYLQNGLFYFCKVVEKINCFRVPLASTFKQPTNSTCFFSPVSLKEEPSQNNVFLNF